MEPPMIFQLITDAQEFLSSFSFPTTFCTICLEEFNNEQPFVKTNCFHIFHEKVEFFFPNFFSIFSNFFLSKKCLAKWYAIKLEDAMIDSATPRYNKKELKDPVWCPTCRCPIDKHIIEPFEDSVFRKTKSYRARLKKEQEEEKRIEELWKLEREWERKRKPQEGEIPTVEIAYAAISE